MKSSLRTVLVASCLMLAAAVRAETVALEGQVTQASNTNSAFAGIDFSNASFSGSMVFSDDPLCGPLHPCSHLLGAATVGGLTFTFNEGSSSLGVDGDTRSLYLDPFESVTVSGAGFSFNGQSSGVYRLFGDGTATWGFSVWTPGDMSSVLRLSGVAQAAAPVPEPSTYALMLAGLAAVAFAAKRRRVTGDQLTA